MTGIEDALREALAGEVRARPHDVLREVRRGARRRRTRRSATAVVAAAAVAVAGIAVAGSLLGGGPTRPAPAPDPTGPTHVATTAPTGNVLAVEAAGEALLATVEGEAGCRCTHLWRYDEATGWSELHEFPEDRVSGLSVAPDGLLGFANASGAIWVTGDGGRTWERAAMPDGNVGRFEELVVATGDDQAPGWAFDVGTGTLLRFDGATFERVRLDRTGGALDAVHVEDGLLVVATDSGFVTRDGGTTWQELELPCAPAVATRLEGAEEAVFAVCQLDDDAVVHRSSDLASWQELGSFPGLLTDLVPLGDDALLMRGAQEVLMGSGGAQPVATGRDFDVQVPDAAVLDGTTYLATSEGLSASDDGGRTWRPAS